MKSLGLKLSQRSFFDKVKRLFQARKDMNPLHLLLLSEYCQPDVFLEDITDQTQEEMVMGIIPQVKYGNYTGNAVSFKNTFNNGGEKLRSLTRKLEEELQHLDQIQLAEEFRVQILNANMNKIREIWLPINQPRDEFHKIIALDLSNNLITSVKQLSSLRFLSILNLSSNKIEGFDLEEDFPQLTALNCTNNFIKSLANFNHLTGIQILNLSGNEIK